MTNPLQVVLAIALLLSIPAVGAEAASTASVAVELRQVILRVEGMTCGGCALSTRIVLERLEGVGKAEVDHERKRTVVSYDPAKVTPAAMVAALKDTLGYTATVVGGEGPR